MARKPTTALSREDKRAQAEAAQQNALLREVDDAVRQGDMESFMARFGKPLAIGVVALLLAFGGYLYWQHQQELALERDGEVIVTALDQVQAGNLGEADEQLAGLAGSDNAAAAQARLLRAGLAAEQGNADEAATLFAAVADDGDAPQALRDLARIREVSTRYDSMEPAQVISMLQPLAAPGRPFFASAGELVAHAYLKQGNRDEAGALFAQIARDENTPESARTRMLNMAGILGVDAVDDVQELLRRQNITQGGTQTGVSAASQ